ncbi:AbiV family abortive infection protein [Rhodococcus qingshengii]|uniref:AbiV family abortive infection protein n=1 Tax=Rhodococcus qingshengii TaxID=334542 RepID=UPI0037C8ABC2
MSKRQLSPKDARQFWLALMTNVAGLIEDARLLFAHESPGRARSLLVLANEELAKAVWIYDASSATWSAGTKTSIELPEDFATKVRDHFSKILEAERYGSNLGPFWGDYSSYEEPQSVEDPVVDIARKANWEKMGGFYVDMPKNGVVAAPQDVSSAGIEARLVNAAAVALMALITDHTRIQGVDPEFEWNTATNDLQGRLLPISNPELFDESLMRER